MSNIETVLLSPEYHADLEALLVDAGIEGAQVTLNSNRTRVFYALKYEGGPEIHSFVHKKWLEGDHAVADSVLDAFVSSVVQAMTPDTGPAPPTKEAKVAARTEVRKAKRVGREDRLKERKARRVETDKVADARGVAAQETRKDRRKTKRNGPPESE
jgi:hypothetical protein